VNLLPYVGVNPLLIWVMGLDDAKAGRKPTEREHAEMAQLLNEAMDAGACGWSTQTLGTPGDPRAETQGGAAQSDWDGTPMPSDVMWPETHEVLARVLGERGEGFIEMSAAGMPREHWERIAELSGAPVIYQAMPASPYMIEMHEDLMAWFERCRAKGLRIYGQGITQNPPLVFTFDYWDLWGPVWNEFTGPEIDKRTKLANMADPAVREKLRSTPLKYMFIAGVNEVKVVETFTPDQQRFVGQSIQEIADREGKHVVDTICDLVVADELRTIFSAAQFDIDMDGLRQLIGNPFVIPGLSDGGAHLKYLAAGSYGTEYIARYVRDTPLTTLEEAHWRLSALPAHCAGFQNRGVLREGAAADIIVYDYDELDYEFPTFRHDLPGDEYRVASAGTGYRFVLVNGQVTIENDEQTNVYSGLLLRHGRWSPGAG
jgi:N-acyl-D-aspartate/D-glutamate deacylase